MSSVEVNMDKQLVDEAGSSCNEVVSSQHEDLASRNVELEKCLAEKNLRIQELETQLSICNEKLAEHKLHVHTRDMEEASLKDKFQLACEARDEFKFKVAELEKEVAKLRKENEPTTKSLSEVKALQALIASHEDQIAKYQEKLTAQEKSNKELRNKIFILQNSTRNDQDSYAQKINNPQTAVQQSSQYSSVRYTPEENRIFNQVKEALKETFEAKCALKQEQEKSAAMKKNYEQEKENLKRELQAAIESHRKLQKDYEKLCNELHSLKQQSLEPEEIIKTKANKGRKEETQDEEILLIIGDREKPVHSTEKSKELHPEVKSGRQLRPRQKKNLYSANAKEEEIGVQQQKKSKRCR